MCELLGLSSNRMATVNLSLATLAEHGGRTGPHRDGWGVAWYEGPDVRLIKEAEAAADSDWIRFIRDHELRSRIIVAHVRRATMGERTYRNTQPFMRELAGRMHLFAHNGWLPTIEDTRELVPRHFHPLGETDSERAFCALLDRMAEIWTQPGDIPPLDLRISVVARFAERLRALGPANFLYSDGDALFAHGDRRKHADTGHVEPPGLFCLERRCPGGAGAFASGGVAVGGEAQAVALVASVPLSEAPWQPLGEGEVIAVAEGTIVRRDRPAAVPAD